MPEFETADFAGVAARYIESWNERDARARSKAIERVWAEDARYTDPLVDSEGREAIAATIAEAQARFPGFVFRLAGPVDGHHNLCRFAWEFGPEGAEAPIAGSDVALVDPDGTLKRVVGFLDRVPAA
ncbi:MAG: nuclear transport factor 2 family protein [Acidimicrobiaceae bacterium]|nr:nuclear transport factor 2 family protein [Acidimicrobiaceae bacterium]